jgi:hypothetical protein
MTFVSMYSVLSVSKRLGGAGEALFHTEDAGGMEQEQNCSSLCSLCLCGEYSSDLLDG